MAEVLQIPAIQVGLEESIAKATARIKPLRLRINDRDFSGPLGRVVGQTNKFNQAITAATDRVVAFGAAASAFYVAKRAVDALVRSTIEVEASLARINVNLNESAEGLKSFSDKLFNVAKTTGQTFDVAAKAAEELARQGLGAEETLKRLKDAMILSRFASVSGAEAVENLTASINSFSNEALDSTTILNKLVAVDTRFAVSTKDLAEGISRAGSTAAAAGVSFDELLGIITSLQQTTARGGAVIGNALKTIFTRVTAAPATIEALQNVGVAIQDSAGATRPAIQILKDYIAVRDGLSDAEKNATDRLVSGTFQINILKAAISDLSKEYSIYGRAVGTASNATDEAIRKNEELNKTLETSIVALQTSFKQLFAEIGKTNLNPIIEGFIKIVTRMSDFLSGSGAGEEAGKTLGQQLLQGISNVITGPGLIGFAAVLVKVFRGIFITVKQELASLGGILTVQKARQSIEANILRTLERANQEELMQFKSAQSIAQQKNVILQIVQRTNAELQKQAIIEKALIDSFLVKNRLLGTSVSKGLNPTTSAPKINIAAGGLLPAVAGEKSSIRSGIGGASPTSKPVIIPNFNYGGGKRGTVVANTSEYIVPNFAGGGSAIFNQDMVKAMGLPAGAKKLAEGYIPNFATFKISPSQIKDLLMENTKFQSLKYASKTTGAIETILAAQHSSMVGHGEKVGAPAPNGYSNWRQYQIDNRMVTMRGIQGKKSIIKNIKWDAVKQINANGNTYEVAANGYVPNFVNPLAQAITRERQAGVPSSQIYIDKDPRVSSPFNPGGLLVANMRDEPRGGFQGVNRVLGSGGNPKIAGLSNGYVPNFAPQPFERKEPSSFDYFTEKIKSKNFDRPQLRVYTGKGSETRFISKKELDKVNAAFNKYKKALESNNSALIKEAKKELLSRKLTSQSRTTVAAITKAYEQEYKTDLKANRAQAKIESKALKQKTETTKKIVKAQSGVAFKEYPKGERKIDFSGYDNLAKSLSGAGLTTDVQAQGVAKAFQSQTAIKEIENKFVKEFKTKVIQDKLNDVVKKFNEGKILGRSELSVYRRALEASVLKSEDFQGLSRKDVLGSKVLRREFFRRTKDAESLESQNRERARAFGEQKIEEQRQKKLQKFSNSRIFLSTEGSDTRKLKKAGIDVTTPQSKRFLEERNRQRAEAQTRYGFGVSIAAGIASGFVPEKEGGTAAGASLGVLSGALQGVSIGALLGPKGMVAGAIVGGVYGGIRKAFKSPEEISTQLDERTAKETKSFDALQRYFDIESQIKSEDSPTIKKRLREQSLSVLGNVSKSQREAIEAGFETAKEKEKFIQDEAIKIENNRLARQVSQQISGVSGFFGRRGSSSLERAAGTGTNLSKLLTKDFVKENFDFDTRRFLTRSVSNEAPSYSDINRLQGVIDQLGKVNPELAGIKVLAGNFNELSTVVVSSIVNFDKLSKTIEEVEKKESLGLSAKERDLFLIDAQKQGNRGLIAATGIIERRSLLESATNQAVLPLLSPSQSLKERKNFEIQQVKNETGQALLERTNSFKQSLLSLVGDTDVGKALFEKSISGTTEGLLAAATTADNKTTEKLKKEYDLSTDDLIKKQNELIKTIDFRLDVEEKLNDIMRLRSSFLSAPLSGPTETVAGLGKLNSLISKEGLGGRPATGFQRDAKARGLSSLYEEFIGFGGKLDDKSQASYNKSRQESGLAGLRNYIVSFLEATLPSDMKGFTRKYDKSPISDEGLINLLTRGGLGEQENIFAKTLADNLKEKRGFQDTPEKVSALFKESKDYLDKQEALLQKIANINVKTAVTIEGQLQIVSDVLSSGQTRRVEEIIKEAISKASEKTNKDVPPPPKAKTPEGQTLTREQARLGVMKNAINDGTYNK